MLAPSPSVIFLDGHNNSRFSRVPVFYIKENTGIIEAAGIYFDVKIDEE